MKRLLYLFIGTTLLFSCTSNDDNSDLDPIIGKWQLVSITVNGSDVSTDCEKNTTITFLENGTTNLVSFYDDGNGCESESDSSTWENVGGSTYKVDNDDEALALTFSENNTVFTASTTETFNGMTYTTVITYRRI